MKKSLLVAAILTSLSVANYANAAPSTFSDVPAKHWAYEAVNKLAQAGIVSGTGNSTFYGDKVLTRYEMAEIVANAMTKADKADAETKAALDKLTAEFAGELKGLGARVENLEKGQSSFKLSGVFQYRYEHVKNPRLLNDDVGLAVPSHWGRADGKNNTRTVLGLAIDNQFDGDTYFHGLLWAETLGGKTTDVDVQVYEAYLSKKIGAKTELAAGKFLNCVSLGTNGGTPYMDGARLSVKGDVSFSVAATKVGSEYVPYYDGSTPPVLKSLPYLQHNYIQAEAKFNVTPDLKATFAYFADNGKGAGLTDPANTNIYKTSSAGLEYKASPTINLSGEYARNNSDFAKIMNNDTAAKAYFLKAKHGGANPFMPGSTGFWVMYKKADPGFDAQAFANPDVWISPFNWTSPSGGGQADNTKGYEIGIESTIAKRTMFKATYNKLDHVKFNPMSLAVDKDQSFYTAQVTYLF